MADGCALVTGSARGIGAASAKALAVAEAEGRLAPGDLVLLAAFGGGLTWGATVVEWGTGDGV